MKWLVLLAGLCWVQFSKAQATYTFGDKEPEIQKEAKRQFAISAGHRRFLNDAPALQLGLKYEPLRYLALRTDAFISNDYGLESITGVTGILNLSRNLSANLGPAFSFNHDGDGKAFFAAMGGVEITFLPRWQVRLGGQTVFRPADLDYGVFGGVGFWL